MKTLLSLLLQDVKRKQIDKTTQLDATWKLLGKRIHANLWMTWVLHCIHRKTPKENSAINCMYIIHVLYGVFIYLNCFNRRIRVNALAIKCGTPKLSKAISYALNLSYVTINEYIFMFAQLSFSHWRISYFQKWFTFCFIFYLQNNVLETLTLQLLWRLKKVSNVTNRVTLNRLMS